MHETGYEPMDAEHRVQLGMMDTLDDAVRRNLGPGAVRLALDGLIGYLEAHFLSEQVLMRERAYPGYENHTGDHDHALQLLGELRARTEARDDALTLEVCSALRRWLMAHIESHDAQLARFLE